MYASSSTTSTSAGTDAMNAPTASGASQVPVGLFGLATNTMRVCGVSAARMAGRSWPSSRAATAIPLRTACLRGQRIYGERVLRIHRLVTRAQECLRRELEDIVGTVAEHYLLDRHAEPGGQRLLQRKAVAVRIARHDCRGVDDRLPHAGTGATRIFVRRELDDPGFGQPVLARQFVDRLARHVRRKALNMTRCLFRNLGGRHRRSSSTTSRPAPPDTTRAT